MSIAADGTTRRGTSNGNVRGSSEDRRRRREWLVQTYRADTDLIRVEWWAGTVSFEQPFTAGPGVAQSSAEELLRHPSVRAAEAVPTCRCYRCGRLLTADTVTVDRIIPGCKGGTYRRNNIRPACGLCNSETGGGLRTKRGAS